jgi:acylphosphatase
MASSVHCLVSGKVQGVWYRASTETEARRLGVSGWVRNLQDGRVEVFAVGESDLLQQLVDWLRRGPPAARVDDVVVDWGEAQAPAGFSVR